MDYRKGQHFLIDSDILKKEISISKISKKDRVIEIGAGRGNLTALLVKKADKVRTFEIDYEFKEDLGKLEDENSNLFVVLGDCLKYSWKSYNKIVANIPYHLSEKILDKSIKEEIKNLTLIVGSRLAKKLKSNEKIGLKTRLFYSVKDIMRIPGGKFEPKTKVSSSLIQLTWIDKISKKEKMLRDILNYEGKIGNAIIGAFVKSGKTKSEGRVFLERFDKKILDKPVSRITGKFLEKLEKEL